MQLYMLDTDISSYIIKQHPLSVLEHFELLDMEQLCISVITYAELRYGVQRSSSLKVNLPVVENFVSRLTILPWDRDAAARYGYLRNCLEGEGMKKGVRSLLLQAE